MPPALSPVFVETALAYVSRDQLPSGPTPEPVLYPVVNTKFSNVRARRRRHGTVGIDGTVDTDSRW